jgi:hypothetical protein
MSSNRTRRISSNSKGMEMSIFPPTDYQKLVVDAMVKDYREDKKLQKLKNNFEELNVRQRYYFMIKYPNEFNKLNTTSILSLRYSAGKRRKTNKRRNKKNNKK